jgi:DNA gyrase subunit A
MIINRSGITIRTAVDGIRMAGRATQGVKVINLREGDSIASVMAVPKSEDAEEVTPVEDATTEGAAVDQPVEAQSAEQTVE